MKKTILVSSLALFVMASQAQAQNSTTNNQEVGNQNQAQQVEQPKRARFDKKRLFQKSAVGCGLGAGIAMLTGKKDKALAGCALGAAAGGFAAYQEQLNEARNVEQAARQAGMNATVQTKDVVDEKTGEKTQALNALVIEYKASDMEAMDANTAATLDKLAALGHKAKNKLTFTFEGKRGCDIPMRELEKRNAFERHTVKDRCGQGQNKITITPMPEV